MPDPCPSLSLIIPAYNEEPGVAAAVARTRATMEAMGTDWEIILVNDCSRDRTGLLIDELSRGDPKIRALHHERNLGIGGAFRTGVQASTREFIMLVPVDNPLLPEDLAAYLPRLPTCDIVVGVRVDRVGYTRFARFASFCYNRLLVPLFFNLGVSDVNWIQAYRRRLFVDGTLAISYPGMFFLVELLAQARRQRLIVVEVPARMQKRCYGRPTCFRPTVMLRTFRDLLHCFILQRRAVKRP